MYSRAYRIDVFLFAVVCTGPGNGPPGGSGGPGGEAGFKFAKMKATATYSELLLIAKKKPVVEFASKGSLYTIPGDSLITGPAN